MASLEKLANRPEVAVGLDIAISYALAMGAEQFLFHRMVLASGRAQTPAWLLPPQQSHTQGSGFAHD